jgi:heat shock protein HslJ
MTARRPVAAVVAAMGLVLVLVATAGCALIPSPWVGRWDLVSVGGTPASGSASVVLTASSVVLATGCNTGAGTYALAGDQLSLDGVAFTARACPGALAAQDAAFRELASGTSTMKVSDPTMTIVPADGAPVLTFRKAGGA